MPKGKGWLMVVRDCGRMNQYSFREEEIFPANAKYKFEKLEWIHDYAPNLKERIAEANRQRWRVSYTTLIE